MEVERIEYLRKSNRKQGKKKGVLWCGIDPDNADGVLVGFSLCHSIDEFDVKIRGKYRERVPGFGLSVAKERGDKWRFHSAYFVQNSYTEYELNVFDLDLPVLYENPDPATIVEIPPSIEDRLRTFLVRCKKYYKDKMFPEWCEAILQNDPYLTIDEEMEND